MTEDEKLGLLYEPAPVIDPWFTEQYNKIVPDVLGAPKGTKKLRFVWGNDRLEYCNGVWERRYGDTDHNPPKYVGRCRWVIEGWSPPNVFDPFEWEQHKEVLGEYPREGVWDFVAFHENLTTKEYLPLDQSALNHLEIWAHYQGIGHKRSVEILLDQKTKLREKRERERREAGNKVAMEFGDDVMREFEKLKETPDAYSLPSGYKTLNSGLIVPQGS